MSDLPLQILYNLGCTISSKRQESFFFIDDVVTSFERRHEFVVTMVRVHKFEMP